MLLKSLICFTSLSLLSVACTNSDFSGDNKKKSNRPVLAPPGTEISTPEGASGAQAGEILAEPYKVQRSVADILIGIDTSGSMLDELGYLQQNMQSMLDQLTQANVESRITAVGTNFNFPTNLPADRFGIVNQPIGSHDMIGVLNNVMNNGLMPFDPKEKGRLEVVMITDDNGKKTPNLAVDFKPLADVHTTVSGIIGLTAGPSPINSNCSIPNVGVEYQTLATQTQGSIFDLCQKDWAALIHDLTNHIAQRAKGFQLTQKPNLNLGIKVFLNGKELAINDWTYNAATNTVMLNEALNAPQGADVVIKYTVAS